MHCVGFLLCLLLSTALYRLMEVSFIYQVPLYAGKVYWFMKEYYSDYFNSYSKYKALPLTKQPVYSENALSLLLRDEKPSNRLYHLDALRGIAAVTIIMCHAAVSIFEKDYKALYLEIPGNRYYAWQYGYAIVPFFVVLSGYILSRVYWTPKRSNNLKVLFIGRMTRFFPVHWFCLGIWLIVKGYNAYHYDNWAKDNMKSNNILPCLTLTHVWALDIHWGSMAAFCNPPAWSLSVEWLFNILMFFVIRLFSVHWGLFFFELAMLFGYNAYTGNKFAASRSTTLAFGFFLGILYEKIVSKLHFKKPLFQFIGDIAGIMLLSSPLTYLQRDLNFNSTIKDAQPSFQAVLYGLYLIIALENSFILKRLFGKLSLLGDVSFAIYLIHDPLVEAYSTLIHKGYAHWITSDIGLLCFQGFVVICSYFLHFYFEIPVKKSLDVSLGIQKASKIDLGK